MERRLSSERDPSHGFWLKTLLFALLWVAAFFGSFLIGRYPVEPGTVFDIIRASLLHRTLPVEDTLITVVMEVRLPRILAALLVGGALSISGASYQTLFKNPMVSPDILGVSAGAGFGAALTMLWRMSWWQTQLSAFCFGVLAVAAAYLISRMFGGDNLTILVLAGVVVSSLFQALLSIIKTLADPDDALPSITFWLMGSLGKADGQDVLVLLPAAVVSLLLLFFFRHSIDALAAGEDEAASMGVDVPLVKLVVIVSSTLLTVSSVSVCGIIGWIGMVVPHIARLLTGASYHRLASTSFLVGGLFLLFIDDLIRGSFGVDLPLGVVTALVGTPVFVLLLSQTRKVWS
ncbi:iron ABC transporter permease [Pseudoflavonifractor sp. MSJ-37]|uniref:FecCD family ABC transporter permease n=1 Tax=Pseudoflavonifractor sp. MSJ-37 TaxID=2841531 RepID=UPI001C1073E3|nr:iron ABC transporter permease [Pseudoflavonifractor sp. MSJ-37]MBU5434627.1 iron ABC transporter permease [Pseudoflavonifractor sp. MSJ-37]